MSKINQNYFQHVITAANVQDAARIVQAHYQEKSGHKLKRSTILEGMSEALKYANKKVMESQKGKVSLHKDIPVWIGTSTYKPSNDYNEYDPKVFAGYSLEDVNKQITDDVINEQFLSTHLCYSAISDVMEAVSSEDLFDTVKNTIFYGVDSEEQSKNPSDWIASTTFVVSRRLAKYQVFKDIIVEKLINSGELEGRASVNCISKGLENFSPYESYLPESNICIDDGIEYTELKGLFAVEPIFVTDYVNDLISHVFDGADYSDDEIYKSLDCFNVDVNIDIAHNHGRKLSKKLIPCYVTIKMKNCRYDLKDIFFNNAL